MTAQVLSFFQRSPRYAPAPADWTQQELAEFYRVESALMRAGIRVGTDRGLSDENEPWFIFYRSDDGEVVIHFARIDGEYIIAGPAYEEIARGFDFSSLVRNMVARHPLVRRPERGDNISLHPAALLVAVVGTAFFKTGEARAAETGSPSPAASHARPVLLSSSSNAGLVGVSATLSVSPSGGASVQLPVNQAVLVLAAALMASEYKVESASLEPSARAALSAAAASLDFTGPAALVSSADGHAEASLSGHVATQTYSPAETVSSVLSLVALLTTMPSLQESSTGGEAVSAVLAHIPASGNSAPLAAPTPENANWAIDVHLGSGALPLVQAVELVRGVVGDASFQKISVIEVTKLPDVLADIISRGTHYTTVPSTDGATDGATETPPTHNVSTDVTPPPTTTPSDPTTTTPPASTLPTGDTTTTTPPKAVADPTPAQPAQPAPPFHSPFASADMVKQFIDYFVAHTDHVSMITQGLQVVIFDSRVTQDPGSIAHLTSMTFDFFDGSSINLVGDSSAFQHPGILF